MRVAHTLAPVVVQIIHVNLTSADLKPIEATGNVEFTYSVHWSPTDIHFSQRFERYLDQNFFEHQVNILSRQLHHEVWKYFQSTSKAHAKAPEELHRQL